MHLSKLGVRILIIQFYFIIILKAPANQNVPIFEKYPYSVPNICPISSDFFPNRSKWDQAGPKLSKFFQTCPNLSKLVQTCPNLNLINIYYISGTSQSKCASRSLHSTRAKHSKKSLFSTCCPTTWKWPLRSHYSHVGTPSMALLFL